MRPRYGTRKPRRYARTLPVKGMVDERGKSYRCWHCGFICIEGRDALGGSNSKSNVIPTDYTEKYSSVTGIGSGTEGLSADGKTPLQLLATSGGALRRVVTLELGSDGNPINLAYAHRANVTTGCPFCGTKNWKGVYP